MNTNRQEFFINNYDRIFTVRLLWSIGQPIVFGTIKEIIKYSLQPNNGIEGFYEVEGKRLRKVSKKELKEIGHYDKELQQLKEELFKKY